TPGCGATENGKSSPARHTVITKTRRQEKSIQKSSVTSSAPTSSRPIKQDRLQPRTTNYSSNAKAKRNDCFPKLPISFSARASKAGSSSVTTPTARSTLSSTAETTKTLSGAKRNKLSVLIPHDHRT